MISNLNKKFFTSILFLACIPIQLRGEDFRIIYSSSLTGNLFSCMCGLKLSVGLTKRATYFKQIGVDPSKDILVDTGNSLDIKSSTNKAKSIFESYQKIGYHSIGIGANDLQENTISLLEANRYSVQSANIFVKGFFGFNGIGKPVTYIKKGKKNIGILAISSPAIIYHLSKEIKSKLIVRDPIKTIQAIVSKDKNSVDTWIVLLHGTSEEAIQIASTNERLLVIFGGIATQPMIPKKGYLESNHLRVYSTGEMLGDKIGILHLSESESGFFVKQSEVNQMDVDKLSDSENILQIMKNHNLKPE